MVFCTALFGGAFTFTMFFFLSLEIKYQSIVSRHQKINSLLPSKISKKRKDAREKKILTMTTTTTTETKSSMETT